MTIRLFEITVLNKSAVCLNYDVLLFDDKTLLSQVNFLMKILTSVGLPKTFQKPFRLMRKVKLLRHDVRITGYTCCVILQLISEPIGSVMIFVFNFGNKRHWSCFYSIMFVQNAHRLACVWRNYNNNAEFYFILSVVICELNTTSQFTVSSTKPSILFLIVTIMMIQNMIIIIINKLFKRMDFQLFKPLKDLSEWSEAHFFNGLMKTFRKICEGDWASNDYYL